MPEADRLGLGLAAAVDHRTAACCSCPFACPCCLQESVAVAVAPSAYPIDSACAVGVARIARFQLGHLDVAAAVDADLASGPELALGLAPAAASFAVGVKAT